MSVLKVKLDVFPLENYLQNPHGDGNEVTGKNTEARNEERESRRHKTPLEKLMSLKARCREEQCVQSVDAVLIAHLHRHPHVLLLKQPQQSAHGQHGRAGPNHQQRPFVGMPVSASTEYTYRLPGGRCRRGETEESCLHRKLGRQLLNEPKTHAGATDGAGPSSDTIVDVSSPAGRASESANYFRVGEALAKWYRPHFSPLMYPYVPPHISPSSVMEVRTVFLVHLEPMVYFNLYREDTELIAVPLFDLYENTTKYGPIIAALPVLLSRVLINYCSTEY